MMRRFVAVAAVAVVCVVGAVGVDAGPGTATSATCKVTFAEAPGDKLTGDGPAAVYEHGRDNVTCTFDLTQGSLHYGDVNLGFGSGRTRRHFVYDSQPDTGEGPGFTEFSDTGTLVVRQIWTVGADPTQPTENRAFVAYAYNSQFTKGAVRFRAAANFSGDSVQVTKIGPCAWSVSFDSTSNSSGTTRVDAWQGSGWKDYRGVYQMPFHFVVEAISGCR